MASACKSALAKDDVDEAFVSDCLAKKTFWEENFMCLDEVDAPQPPPCFTGAQLFPRRPSVLALKSPLVHGIASHTCHTMETLPDCTLQALRSLLLPHAGTLDAAIKRQLKCIASPTTPAASAPTRHIFIDNEAKGPGGKEDNDDELQGDDQDGEDDEDDDDDDEDDEDEDDEQVCRTHVSDQAAQWPANR